jgi:hypothetical protein
MAGTGRREHNLDSGIDFDVYCLAVNDNGRVPPPLNGVDRCLCKERGTRDVSEFLCSAILDNRLKNNSAGNSRSLSSSRNIWRHFVNELFRLCFTIDVDSTWRRFICWWNLRNLLRGLGGKWRLLGKRCDPNSEI